MRLQLLVPFAIGVFALFMRLPGLGAILTADEPQWIFRAKSFYTALERGDPGGTFQGTHPGVMPMLLIGGGIRARELTTGETLESPTVGRFRRSAKLPITIAVALAVGISAGFASRLWGNRVGATIGALLALHPFFLGHAQLAHVDALLAALMLLSVFALFLYTRSGERRFLALSGLCGGFALLTKLPAAFLLPLVLFHLTLHESGESRARLRSWRLLVSGARNVVVQAAIWAAWAVGVFLLLWPSMWLKLLPNIQYFARDVATVVTLPHEGEITDDGEGRAFYVRAFVARTPPLMLLLGVGGMVTVLRSRQRSLRREGGTLVVSILGFALLVSVAEKQGDRYLLPMLVTFTVFAGVALARVFRAGRVGVAAAGGVLLWLILFDLSLRPYALSYQSPLAWREDPTQSGWGEGLEAAALLLNAHPLARDLQVATRYPVILREFFHGETMSLSSREDRRVDYVVLYRNMRGRSASSPAASILAEFKNRVPERTIRVHGREMAWVYRTDSVDVFPSHVGELVGEAAFFAEAGEREADGALEAGQIVFPTRNGLAGVRLVFSTFSSRPNTAEVLLHLRSSPDGEDLRTVQIDTRSLEDREWSMIRFDPIPDSRGKRYYLAVTSPTGRPGNAVTVNFQSRDVLPGARVLLRRPLRPGETREAFTRQGDLAYTLVYEDGTSEDPSLPEHIS